MTPEHWVAGLVGAAATVDDLRRREISNWIPLTALVAGTACQVYRHGWWGLGNAALGAICGFLVFIIFYWLGGMGGGDVKLMAGFGALLGASTQLLEASIFTAIVGALLAAGVIAYGAIRNWVRSDAKAGAARSIPYAPAITLGVWLSLVGKG
jgi:prepilin peptidase CpaA